MVSGFDIGHLQVKIQHNKLTLAQFVKIENQTIKNK